MRGERGSSGYEVVFVPTEAQRDAYVEAIRSYEQTVVDPIRFKVVRTDRFGEKGYSIGARTRVEEAQARRAIDIYINNTFKVGTRIRTLVTLIGARPRPAGTLGTVTKTEGFATPLVTFDNDDTGGPYTVGPWWMEVVA